MVSLVTSGIYQIRNLINDKIYIGSSINLRGRWATHKYYLNKNSHHSKYLQHSYNKYNKNNFKFEVLVTCPAEYLLKLEQWFLDNLRPEYNTVKIAGNNLGFKHSAESKRKIAEFNIGRKYSEESKLKMSIAKKGRKQTLHHRINSSIPVLKICKKTGNVLGEYFSMTEAASKNNTTKNGISSACKGRTKTCKGFIWKLKNKLQ